MKEVSISAVVMTLNEENNIEAAVNTLSFADQIVVADTGSTDKTTILARQAGAEVHSISFDGYGPSKNRAVEFCRGDWIFVMDADERVSEELARSIGEKLSANSDYAAFRVCRLTYFLGKPIMHSGWYPDYVVRLFKKGKGRFSENLVHERLEVEGRTARLDGLLYHHSYNDLQSYLEKMTRYSALSAQEMFRNGRQFRLIDLMFRPPAVFLKMYVLKRGFLDGLRGFILAVLSSYHVFLKYAKLRELYGRQRA